MLTLGILSTSFMMIFQQAWRSSHNTLSRPAFFFTLWSSLMFDCWCTHSIYIQYSIGNSTAQCPNQSSVIRSVCSFMEIAERWNCVPVKLTRCRWSVLDYGRAGIHLTVLEFQLWSTAPFWSPALEKTRSWGLCRCRRPRWRRGSRFYWGWTVWSLPKQNE